LLENPVVPLAPGLDGLADGALPVRVLGGCVEERAAAEISRHAGAADASEDRRKHLARCLLRKRRHGLASDPILVLDIGEDEIVL
jgi:hypothetical protein